MFPYLGLCELDSTYVIELGCIVGITHRQGPSYTTDAAILKEDRSDEGSGEGSGEGSEEETEEEQDKDVTLMVQVHTQPMQGVWTGKLNVEPRLSS